MATGNTLNVDIALFCGDLKHAVCPWNLRHSTALYGVTN